MPMGCWWSSSDHHTGASRHVATSCPAMLLGMRAARWACSAHLMFNLMAPAGLHRELCIGPAKQLCRALHAAVRKGDAEPEGPQSPAGTAGCFSAWQQCRASCLPATWPCNQCTCWHDSLPNPADIAPNTCIEG